MKAKRIRKLRKRLTNPKWLRRELRFWQRIRDELLSLYGAYEVGDEVFELKGEDQLTYSLRKIKQIKRLLEQCQKE